MYLQTLILLILAFHAPKKEFHQGVDYKIEARLDETTNVLTGRAALRYTNKSPDALDTLYFHLHLNAFRPNSAFANRELQFNQRRFTDLGPDDYGFDRITSITVNGQKLTPVFPLAPDSTVMAVPLRAKIAPQAVANVRIDWNSRLSATATRREGRKGRHYDWAHWYPRIAVYDTGGWEYTPLVPQGEFYGEYASYDVTLDVAKDQIVAATGVPVSGDPGWPVPAKQRTVYAAKAPTSLGLLGKTNADRKRIRWRAEKVHHFAWSTDPDYVYEGGQVRDVALHAFYPKGDTFWIGKVIAQMKSAIQFYDTTLGPYVYPQLTSAWRIDRGATEFPMYTSHSSPPAVVHETGHEWAHAMFGNNEWKQGWLDEGFVTYLQFLYDQANGRVTNFERAVGGLARMDSAGVSQPLSFKSADFRDFNIYQAMTYSRPAVVMRMLQYYIGEQNMRKALKLFYKQNLLTHVDEDDFRRAFEQASGMDLKEFFQQWFHTTGTIDYAVKNATITQQSNGQWLAKVEVERNGENWMPVDLQVGLTRQRLDNRERNFTVEIPTIDKPNRVTIDPDFYLLDVRRSNNVFVIQ